MLEGNLWALDSGEYLYLVVPIIVGVTNLDDWSVRPTLFFLLDLMRSLLLRWFSNSFQRRRRTRRVRRLLLVFFFVLKDRSEELRVQSKIETAREDKKRRSQRREWERGNGPNLLEFVMDSVCATRRWHFTPMLCLSLYPLFLFHSPPLFLCLSSFHNHKNRRILVLIRLLHPIISGVSSTESGYVPFEAREAEKEERDWKRRKERRGYQWISNWHWNGNKRTSRVGSSQMKQQDYRIDPMQLKWRELGLKRLQYIPILIIEIYYN